MSTIDDTPWRRALRAYPASWRAHHGDAMLGTLLDEADAVGRSEPTRGERFALIRGGLAVRIGQWMPPVARDVLAAAAAATGVALALTFAVFSGFAPRIVETLPIDHSTPELQASPGLISAGLWVIAFALIVCGAARAARVALALTAVAGLGVWIYAQADPSAGPRTITITTLTVCALLAALAPVRARLSVATSAAATTGILVFLHLFFEVWPGAASTAIWQRVLTEEFTGFLAGAVWVLAAVATVIRVAAVARHVAEIAVVWTIIWLIRLTMWDVAAGVLTLAAFVAVAAVGIGLFRAGARYGRHRQPEPLR